MWIPYCKLIVWSVVLLALSQSCSCSTDYCKISACGTAKHIACGNDGKFGPKCTADAKIVPMTPTLIQFLLHLHNDARNKIAAGHEHLPPGTCLSTMQWDPELAYFAELNVKRCDMIHDDCRSTDKYPMAGQNLAIRYWKGTEPTVEEIAKNHVNIWFNEYKDTDVSQIGKYTSKGKMISHFTAMVDEKSNRVGCAIMRQTDTDGFRKQVMACNLARRSIWDKPVYTAGKAASGCKTGINPKYKNLCSINEY